MGFCDPFLLEDDSLGRGPDYSAAIASEREIRAIRRTGTQPSEQTTNPTQRRGPRRSFVRVGGGSLISRQVLQRHQHTSPPPTLAEPHLPQRFINKLTTTCPGPHEVKAEERTSPVTGVLIHPHLVAPWKRTGRRRGCGNGEQGSEGRGEGGTEGVLYILKNPSRQG